MNTDQLIAKFKRGSTEILQELKLREYNMDKRTRKKLKAKFKLQNERKRRN